MQRRDQRGLASLDQGDEDDGLSVGSRAPNGHGDLLAAKLALPRLPPGYVDRPQVMELLDAGAKGRVTVVSAGPGWGKTMAAAAWARGRPAAGEVAWVSLDEGDDQPRVFWSYVLSALRRTGVVSRDNPLAGLVPGAVVTEDTIHRIVLGLGRLTSPVILVLDDVHEISNPAVLEGIAGLLRHPIPTLHLVLLTRVDPPLALHRLRVSGDLTEIRARDLAFGRADTAAVLAADGLHLDAEDLAVLVRRTEGWATGVRLAGLYLLRAGPHNIASFAGDDRAVSDYLVGELLASQPEQLRQFLLRTSVTDRITGGLADALTGGSRGAQTLDHLERANAFVMLLGEQGHWYRYHPLLRELLRHELSLEEPTALATLQARAAEWFAEHGHPLDAMRYATEAGDWALFGRLLVNDAGPRLLSAERDSLGRILARAPADHGTPGAEKHLAAASRSYLESRLPEVEHDLVRAEAALAETPEVSRTAAEVMLSLFRTAQGRYHGDMGLVIGASSRALHLLDSSPRPFRAGPGYRAIALSNLGTGLLWSGAMEEAERHLGAGLRAAEETGVEAAQINLLAHLGVVAMARGRLTEAASHGTRALAIAARGGWTRLEQTSSAYLTLALVNLQWNNLSQAEEFIALGLGAHPAGFDRVPTLALRLAEIRILTARGRVPLARDRAARLHADLVGWTPPAYLAGWLAVAEAEIALAEGRPEAARTRLAPPMDTGRPGAQQRVLLARTLLAEGDPRGARDLVAPLTEGTADLAPAVEAWVVTALAADRMREDHQATSALQGAVALAEREGLRRPFVAFAPDRLGALLERMLVATGSTGSTGSTRSAGPTGAPGPSGLAGDVIADLDGLRGGARVPPLGETLTDRELSVLSYLPTMMSNAEIAKQMSVSANTVKAHLKTLYRKLGVSSRRQAVDHARALHLLRGPSPQMVEPRSLIIPPG